MRRAGFAEKTLSESEPKHSETTIKALGEFGLIARLTAGLTSRPDVVGGGGDGWAVVDLGGDLLTLATCDAMLDGEHFLSRVASPEQIGRRAMAVNLSDIASMGG